MKNKNAIRLSRQDKVFEGISYVILSLLSLIVLYPLYFIVIASFSDPQMVNGGQVFLIPKGITWDGYQKIFSYAQLWTGYRNTIFYTLLGTVLNVSVTMLTAYPMSRKQFYGKKFFLFYMMFTMYFGGGLIPTYLVCQKLGLVNRWPVMVILGLVSISNIIVCITFLRSSIPTELYEAAYIDGISHFQNFWQIVLPLSKPIIAVMCLYSGVGHWNDYWKGMIYLNDQKLYPLQLILRGILTLDQIDFSLLTDYEEILRLQSRKELIKYGIIIVSTVPMLVIYPFLQKYFVKGVMIGSLKG